MKSSGLESVEAPVRWLEDLRAGKADGAPWRCNLQRTVSHSAGKPALLRQETVAN